MRTTEIPVTIRAMIQTHASMQGPAVYRVCVEGRIPLDWSARLMGMNITHQDDGQNGGRTTLVGRLPDQAALAGILNTLYDKQYPVVSVECLEVG